MVVFPRLAFQNYLAHLVLELMKIKRVVLSVRIVNFWLEMYLKINNNAFLDQTVQLNIMQILK